jgi:hypothetical protein
MVNASLLAIHSPWSSQRADDHLSRRELFKFTTTLDLAALSIFRVHACDFYLPKFGLEQTTLLLALKRIEGPRGREGYSEPPTLVRGSVSSEYKYDNRNGLGLFTWF